MIGFLYFYCQGKRLLMLESVASNFMRNLERKSLFLTAFLATLLVSVSSATQTPFSASPPGTPEGQQKAIPMPERSTETAPDLHITWYGHACFRIHGKGAQSVLTDPFDASIGYRPPKTQPGVVTVSHAHPDHSAVSQIKGNPVVLDKPGPAGAGGVVFTGIPSWHDEKGGAERGENLIFLWEMSGIKIAHLGDLGQSVLTNEQRAALSHVDVLFIPVGGVYTIDGAQA